MEIKPDPPHPPPKKKKLELGEREMELDGRAEL
jgi:hypothetical protein